MASTGPNYSVPGRIDAQSKIDDVYWVNISGVIKDEWKSKSYFHDSKEIGGLSLSNVEKHFPNIDIVVFEGFYNRQQVLFSKELVKRGISYIIVPRSSLTRQAIHNHAWLKKKFAHWLYFDSYCHKAKAIQYLTKRELDDSGNKWSKNNLIIPNGINIPVNKKETFFDNGFHAVYVGRIDVYQKGIDILLKACEKEKEYLRSNQFRLTLYGPQIIDFEYVVSLINNLGIGDFVEMGGEVLGKEKEKAILNGDLFILTSRFEGHPMGLIEALAYGLPSLVTPGTNMAKEITEANAGWVCDTNVESIQKALRQIINSKDDLYKKSTNARMLASQYDWMQIARKFHFEISNLISAE